MSEDPDIDEQIIVKVSDYVEGALTGAEKEEVANKIATDPVWKQTHDEMVEARKMISGLRPAKAPETFVEDVTGTIHKRSAGRFFARRTLGDRVPFGVLLIVAILALGVIAYLMKSSPTGSLKVDKQTDSTHAPEKPIPTP
jgi:anti-sigma factor RsiW